MFTLPIAHWGGERCCRVEDLCDHVTAAVVLLLTLAGFTVLSAKKPEAGQQGIMP